MEKYFDEKIVSDKEALIINEEFKKLNEDISESFLFYQKKFTIQNILNIVNEILDGFFKIGVAIKNLEGHISPKNKKLLLEKYTIIQNQQKNLTLIYNIETAKKEVQIKNAFVFLVTTLCENVKLYLRLLDFEKNEDVKKIIKEYINDIIDTEIFVVSLGANSI